MKLLPNPNKQLHLLKDIFLLFLLSVVFIPKTSLAKANIEIAIHG